MIDEVMFEIRELTGQEYRNVYAGKTAETERRRRRRRASPTSPTSTTPRAGRGRDRATSSRLRRLTSAARNRAEPAARGRS